MSLLSVIGKHGVKALTEILFVCIGVAEAICGVR